MHLALFNNGLTFSIGGPISNITCGPWPKVFFIALGQITVPISNLLLNNIYYYYYLVII